MVKQKSGNNKTQQTANRPRGADTIEKAIQDLEIMSPKIVRYLFNAALVSLTITIVLLAYDAWYTRFPLETLYFSGGVAFIVYLLLADNLFRQFPETVKILWRRKLLKPPAGGSARTQAITIFLQNTQLRLSSRISLIAGTIGLLIGIWLIWLFDQIWLSNISIYVASMPAALFVALFIRVTFAFSCFVCGLVAWQIFIIGKQIHAIGIAFSLDVKNNHPDGCGGLSPIGDLCLKLAYCIAPFLILIGMWLILVNMVDVNYLHMPFINIEKLISTLQVLLMPFIALGFLIFFFPIMSIHGAMRRARSIVEARLDAIHQKIHLFEMELLNQMDNLDPDRRTTIENNIEFLVRSCGRFQSAPIWPFRASHLFRLTSAQIIPLVGTASSLVSFIKELSK